MLRDVTKLHNPIRHMLQPFLIRAPTGKSRHGEERQCKEFAGRECVHHWRFFGRDGPVTVGNVRSFDRLFMVARENGIGDGFTVLRHLPGEAIGSCSFAVNPKDAVPTDMLCWIGPLVE